MYRKENQVESMVEIRRTQVDIKKIIMEARMEVEKKMRIPHVWLKQWRFFKNITKSCDFCPRLTTYN